MNDEIWNLIWCQQIMIKIIWKLFECITSSVIGQKGESQNGCFKKTKQAKFSDKQIFLTPWYECVSRGKKHFFFGKFAVLCFFETRVLRFTLLAYYRQLLMWHDVIIFLLYLYLEMFFESICWFSESSENVSFRLWNSAAQIHFQ